MRLHAQRNFVFISRLESFSDQLVRPTSYDFGLENYSTRPRYGRMINNVITLKIYVLLTVTVI